MAKGKGGEVALFLTFVYFPDGNARAGGGWRKVWRRAQ